MVKRLPPVEIEYRVWRHLFKNTIGIALRTRLPRPTDSIERWRRQAQNALLRRAQRDSARHALFAVTQAMVESSRGAYP